jgi:hypothetical protein
MYFHHIQGSGSVDKDLIEASRIEIRKILVIILLKWKLLNLELQNKSISAK